MGALIFHQLFEKDSSTYTYLLGDATSREAILIDPVLEMIDRDLKLIAELDLKLILVLDTHVHADHVTGAGAIRDRMKGQTKTAISRSAGIDCSDLPLEDGQELKFGSHVIRALTTPGHTDSCVSYYLPSEKLLFTGDALLIRGNGRTDFQQGSSDTLFESVTRKLFSLPGETKVYPAHDYHGQTSSTIESEMKFNPRLGGGRTKEQFKKTMSELKLSLPAKIHEALPANLSCGKRGPMFEKRMENGIPEITPEDLSLAMSKSEWKSKPVRLIDVRRPDEYVGEFGHIEGAELVTLGPDLQAMIDAGNPNEAIVFICRSGGRSGQATGYAESKGYKNVFNMRGGMIRWSELKLPSTNK
jgi:sulfur dioxygenase